MKIMDYARRMVGIPERRETLELNADDQALLDRLKIDIGNVNVKGKNALKIDTVYACIRILSESVAKLPVKVYQEDEHGIQKAAKHHIYQLLKLRPNPLMSAYDFWKCVEAQNGMHGNAYAELEFEPRSGKIIGLWPLDATKVKIMVDDIGLIGSNTHLWYEVDVGYGKNRKLMPNQILHFKGGITLDGIVGLSPLDYLKATFENAASANKFINNFYKQGLQVKGIIQYVGDLDENAKKNFREKFESMSSGLKNSHRVALMPVGYQFVPMSLSMHDAQFLENNEVSIRQIATAYGIKMHQINNLERATHSNVAEQQREFYTDTLQSKLTMYEQEMSWKVFLPEELDDGYHVLFNIDAILRADIAKRYAAYRIGIQGGFLTANEARAKENLPSEEGGDVLLVNGNVMPITMAGQQYTKGGDGTGQEGNKDDEGDPGTAGNA